VQSLKKSIMSTHKTAMILAAGKGTRLEKLTAKKPKALVEVNGICLIDRVIKKLVQAGFTHFVINVHHFANQLIEHLKTADYQHLKIDISDESTKLLETGGGILKARHFFSDSQYVLVHNVDILTNLDFETICSEFEKSADEAWLLTQNRISTRKLLFQKQQLIGWHHIHKNVFKWVNDSQPYYTELAFSGIHLFKPKLFEPFTVQHCSVIDLYLELAKSNQIKSKEINPEFWFDIGKINEYEAIEHYFKQIENN
jgi:NDP-sugar pyrophosphorylase family protein